MEPKTPFLSPVPEVAGVEIPGTDGITHDNSSKHLPRSVTSRLAQLCPRTCCRTVAYPAVCSENQERDTREIATFRPATLEIASRAVRAKPIPGGRTSEVSNGRRRH